MKIEVPDNIHHIQYESKEGLVFPDRIKSQRDLVYAQLYFNRTKSGIIDLENLCNLVNADHPLTDNIFIKRLVNGLRHHPYCEQLVGDWRHVLENPSDSNHKILFPHIYQMNFQSGICDYIGLFTVLFKSTWGFSSGILYDPRMNTAANSHRNNVFRITPPPFYLEKQNESYKIKSYELKDQQVKEPNPVLIIGRRSMYPKGYGAEDLWADNYIGAEKSSYITLLKENALTPNEQ